MESRSVTRLVGAGLLTASGMLQVASSWQRWGGRCSPGDYDTDVCLATQDHAADYLPATHSWAIAGNAAQLTSLSMLLLAVAAVMLPVLLAGRYAGRVTRLTGTLLGASILVVSVSFWLSGRDGEFVSVPGLFVAGLLSLLVWPLSLFVVAILPLSGGAREGNVWRLLFAGALAAGTPLAAEILTGAVTGYVSYDSTPWSEAVAGVFLLVSALLLWPASRPLPAPVSTPPDDRAVATGITA